MKLSVFITGLLFILFSFNVQAQCPTTNLVENPGQFQWTFHPASATNSEPYYSGVMEVGETTLIITMAKHLLQELIDKKEPAIVFPAQL